MTITVKGDVITHEALAQADWYIDSVNGNDGNSGASGSPLKTIGEYTRRIGDGIVRAAGVSHVYLSGDFDEGDYIFKGSYPNGLEIYGERTVIGTGTISAVQQWAVATSDDGQIEDDSLAVSWTASGFLGGMLVLTSGPNAGAVGWIAKDLGAKTARHSPMAQYWGFTLVHPSIGNTYEVCSLTEIVGTVVLECSAGAWGVTFQDIHFESTGLRSTASAGIYLVGCAFTATGTVYHVLGGWLMDAMSCKIAGGVQNIDVDRASVFHVMYSLLCAKLYVENGSQLSLDNSLIQNDFGGELSVQVIVRRCAYYHHGSGPVGYYDNDDATASVLRLSEGSTGSLKANAKLFGTGNACTGVFVGSGCQLLYPDGDNATDHFAVATSGVEARIGGVDKTYAEIGLSGFVNVANMAMVVPTE